MVFTPVPCKTRWEGVAVAFWIVLIDLLFLLWMLRRPVDWLKYLLILLVVASVPLLIHLVYRTWAAFTLEYWVDRNAVTLKWATRREVIPLQVVDRVIRGGVENLGGSGRLNWPAPYIGGGRALGLLNITMAATLPLPECLLLETDSAVYAVSPMETEAFLTAVQTRYRLGPVQNVGALQERSSPWQRLFDQDTVGGVLLGTGLVGTLVLFGVLMLRFPDLPDVMAFHYNSEGLPDLIREKSSLFLLPAIGFLAWLTNGLWGAWMALHDQRIGAYMLWGGAIIVQICSLLALNSLTQ